MIVWDTSPSFSPAEFYSLCASHDWTYQFSDDHRAWKRGVAEAEVLLAAVNQTPALRSIYSDWVAFINSRTDFPRPLPPK
jgi:hypothetical protein